MDRRPFRSEDLDAIAAIHRAAYRPYVEQIWASWDDAEQRARVAHDCAESECEVFVEDGEVAGYLQCFEDDQQLRVWNIVLGVELQRRGIGTSILSALQERARAHRVPMTLRAFLINQGARRLYERLGFRERSRDDRFVELCWP